MSLNKAKGNMYGFITHTFNIVKGICPHNCSYCYMRRHWPRMSAPRLDESEFRTIMGEGDFIFVGSSIDMFAAWISQHWVKRSLDYCRMFDKASFLFQSKNPGRFKGFIFPKDSILCTTLETNLNPCKLILGNCPTPEQRMKDFIELNFRKMITIEPVMDFDIDIFIQWVRMIDPIQVNIGADSGGNNLPEPSPEKLKKFITALKAGGLNVYLKDNLKRIMK